MGLCDDGRVVLHLFVFSHEGIMVVDGAVQVAFIVVVFLDDSFLVTNLVVKHENTKGNINTLINFIS